MQTEARERKRERERESERERERERERGRARAEGNQRFSMATRPPSGCREAFTDAHVAQVWTLGLHSGRYFLVCGPRFHDKSTIPFGSPLFAQVIGDLGL